MKAALLFIFALAFFICASVANAQTERSSEPDYNTAFAKALASAAARERQVLTMEKFYNGAELKGTRRIISEFAGPDAKKIEVTEEFGDSRSINDAVEIGDQFFCRDGNKGRKTSGKDCSKTGMLAIPHGEYEYLAETDPKDAKLKIYTRRATFADAGSAERDAVRLKFIEIKFVVDESGILEYTETRRGGIVPHGWSSTQVTSYEYEPMNLKIADPTK